VGFVGGLFGLCAFLVFWFVLMCVERVALELRFFLCFMVGLGVFIGWVFG